ncbi:hypothetical protein CVT26_005190 [Gymnopilus dilepis]|uniref:26S proteasome regulatory subunit Rpn6 N-terminal domain-containing protein n=1 Tax=Gymnopilus dilepis TaxID=231916 RepID=A0A409X4T5_9AGAR|nr:hypothetical protein CVT26_005190 [Gymnopilus dilepis]
MASTSTTPLSIPSLLTKADSVRTTDPAQAEVLYKQVLNASSPGQNQDQNQQQQEGAQERSDVLRNQEVAIVKLGELYRDQRNAQGLADVITQSRAFMSSTAKAKTAKLIQTLLDYFTSIPGSQQIQMKTLTDNIAWAKQEKRIFLKHSLETRLVGLQLESKQYAPALALIDTLLTELKRLDDKMILTEVHLLESRVYRGIGNLAKAKVCLRPPHVLSLAPFPLPARFSLLPTALHLLPASCSHPPDMRADAPLSPTQAALTSSRTAANAIYCPPHLQASLDLQSGILHAEDKDYTTAYSYFFEAFENMSAQGEGGEKALGALKYMLLCKVMLNLPEDVNSLLTIKLALKYANMRDVESMRAIARAHQDRNLADFEKALRDYRVVVLYPDVGL